jgi:hypothetical protein
LTHLQFFRDVAYPFTLNILRRREVLLTNYAQRSIENDRRAHDELFGIKNSRKAYLGRIAGLQDPAVLKAKGATEAALRQKVTSDPALSSAYGDAWQNVDDAIATYRPIYVEYRFIEGGLAFNSGLFRRRKPLFVLPRNRCANGERLRSIAIQPSTLGSYSRRRSTKIWKPHAADSLRTPLEVARTSLVQ